MDRRAYCGLVAATALSGCSALSGGVSEGDVGESYETDAGVELTVDRLETQTGGSVQFEDGGSISGGSDAITFVLPYLTASNTTESAQSVPFANNFTLLSEGRRENGYQEDRETGDSASELTITEPVSGPLFPPESEVGPEGETGGWLIFTIPNAGSTVTLELREDDDVVMEWSLNLSSDQ